MPMLTAFQFPLSNLHRCNNVSRFNTCTVPYWTTLRVIDVGLASSFKGIASAVLANLPHVVAHWRSPRPLDLQRGVFAIITTLLRSWRTPFQTTKWRFTWGIWAKAAAVQWVNFVLSVALYKIQEEIKIFVVHCVCDALLKGEGKTTMVINVWMQLATSCFQLLTCCTLNACKYGFGWAKQNALPERPARPVRPIRWT